MPVCVSNTQVEAIVNLMRTSLADFVSLFAFDGGGDV